MCEIRKFQCPILHLFNILTATQQQQQNIWSITKCNFSIFLWMFNEKLCLCVSIHSRIWLSFEFVRCFTNTESNRLMNIKRAYCVAYTIIMYVNVKLSRFCRHMSNRGTHTAEIFSIQRNSTNEAKQNMTSAENLDSTAQHT